MEDLSAADAFERYVVPEIDVMLRVARSLTRHKAEAEDLVQDSLVRAYKGIDRFDGRYPRAWLLTIVRNTHINRNRKQRPELLRDPDAQSSQPVDTEPTPDQRVDLGFDAELSAALDSLSDKYRRVVELVDIDGLSYAEAAEVLDVPQGTIMSRLHRSRAKLRKHLEGAGVTLATEGGRHE